MTRLRYTGAHPVTFLTGGAGDVEPGGEFDVDDPEPFLRRADIEEAAAAEPKPARGKASAGKDA